LFTIACSFSLLLLCFTAFLTLGFFPPSAGLAMSSSSSSAVLLLLLVCFPSTFEAVCPECLESNGHLSFCTRPIAGTDTSGNPEAASIGAHDWLPNPAIFSPLASGVEQIADTKSPAGRHSTVCTICGKKFKNNRGVLIHAGRLHKDHITATSTTSTTPPLSTPTSVSTPHIHQQVTAEGRGLSSEQILPTRNKEMITKTTTSTTTNRAAVHSMSSTNYSFNNPTAVAPQAMAQPPEQPRRLRARRQQTGSRTTQPKRTPQQPMKCVCSAVCQGYVGLVSHRRSCSVFKLLLKGPMAMNINTAAYTTTDNIYQPLTTNNNTDTVSNIIISKTATTATALIDASIESTQTSVIRSPVLDTA